MSNLLVIYILSAFFLVWLFTFIGWIISKRNQRKLLQKIRENWGKANREHRNYGLIENFSLLTTDNYFHKLNAQTINDIDLHDVFEFIDHTNSKPGQQYLYNKIIKPTDNIKELENFNDQVNYFTKNKQERENAQLLLLTLNTDDAYYISNLLDKSILEDPKWSVLFLIDTALVISALLFSLKFSVLLIWLMLPFAINIFLYFRYKNTTGKFNKSFPQLNILINTSKLFVRKDFPFGGFQFKQSIENLSSFQKKFRLLNFSETPKNEFAQIAFAVFELVKAFFLIEIHSFFSCLKHIKNKREDINNLFNFIGSIDAALSIASLRDGSVAYTTPVFINHKKEFSAKDIYHPLVENCVANSIEVKGRSILLTGSNMSGKSTFIRAIAINSILAQTIYTCFADEFITPFVKVFSSIRIADNLSDAKSYYFEEVNVISGLINQSTNSFQNLFILDEVFKGTNTIERVAAAKAILSYLNRNDNLVFVSTHDIELAELLKTEYDLYHFVEDIENDKLIFDHKLKTGQLTSRNAIKILELSNYPEAIIAEAKSIATKN